MAEAKKPEKANDDRLWATLAHLSGFLTFVLPFSNIVAPLLIWLVKKETSHFAAEHAKEATNFQISMSIYGLIAGFSVIFLVGILLLPILAIVWIVLMIQAAMKANSGEKYSYPLTIRLVK